MRSRPLLVWLFAFLVALDLMARVIATQLPAPRVFANYNIQRQAERIEEADGSCIEIALLGTSLMGAAGRPADLIAELDPGTRATNAAVGGGGLLLLDAWIRDLVIPSLCPSLAVIGLGPRDVNDSFAGPQSTLDDYLVSTGRRRITGDLDVLGRLDELAERSLGLLQLRTAYREPVNAAALVVNGSGDWRPATDSTGQITFFTEGAYTPSPDREAALLDGAFADFSVGGRNLDALEAAIVTLQQAGVSVVVVDMPRVAAAHERLIGPVALADYESALASVTGRRGVVLLQADEFEELQDDAVFADEYHLNRQGSASFSRWLGSNLTED